MLSTKIDGCLVELAELGNLCAQMRNLVMREREFVATPWAADVGALLMLVQASGPLVQLPNLARTFQLSPYLNRRDESERVLPIEPHSLTPEIVRAPLGSNGLGVEVHHWK